MARQPLGGFARIAIVLATFAIGCAVSVGLWTIWAARCGDACPVNTLASMLIFLAVLPSVGTILAVLTVAVRWPARLKTGIVLVAAIVALAVAIWLGDRAGASAMAVGLR